MRIPYVLVAAAALLALPDVAMAQSRSFGCPANAVTGASLTISVLNGGRAIKAGPVLGQTGTLTATGQGFTYAGTGVTISIAADQSSATVAVAGRRPVTCRVGAAVATPTPTPTPPTRGPDAPPPPPQPVVNVSQRDFLGGWSTQIGAADCLGCIAIQISSQGANAIGLTLSRRNGTGFSGTLQFQPIAGGRLAAVGTVPGGIQEIVPDAEATSAQIRAERRNGDDVLYITVNYRSRRGFSDVLRMGARR